MEVSSVASSSASQAPLEAQAKLQKKASTQKEEIVATLIEGAQDSAPKAQASGKNLLGIA